MLFFTEKFFKELFDTTAFSCGFGVTGRGCGLF
jgi:hypothetical protein